MLLIEKQQHTLAVSCRLPTAHSALSCESRHWLSKLHLVHLREIKRVEMFVAIQRCSCVITLVTVIHWSVFICLYFMFLCVCVRCSCCMLAYIVHCPRASCTCTCCCLFLFCCGVLQVLLSLAFPLLTIYSKVSFSAGLQGNDTEDYCLDQ